MKTICVIILIVTLSQGCRKSDDCLPGYQYLSEAVSSKIELIHKSAKSRQSFNGNTYRAVFFLEKISGISSSVSFGDVSVYENLSDFKNDRKRWLSWLDEHRCNILDQEVKTLEQSVIEDTPWIK